MLPDDDIEITGDTEAWFAAFDAGTFAERYALTERAIALETQRAHADLHRETPGSIPSATHAALDASDD